MSHVAYTGAAIAICEAARSLPNPPTGDGADVSDWTRPVTSLDRDGVAVGFVELTILAGADVTLADGAMLVAEEVHDTYPEESIAVTCTNGTETINLNAHGFYTGDGPVRLSADVIPTGLSASTEYYVIRTGANTFQLAATRADALAATEVLFTTDGTNPVLHWVTGTKSTSTAADGVSTTALEEWLTFAAPHGIVEGTRIQVSNSGGALPTGLAADTDYYAIVDADDTIAFAVSLADAIATPAVRINLTAAGSGTNSVISDNRGPTEATQYIAFATLNEGYAIDLTADIGYRELVAHRPGVVAYHLVATLDVFVPISAKVRGLRETDW